MNLESFRAKIESGESPPEDLAPELTALWHTKAGNWEAAHDIAQDIPTAMGSWIHGLLHAIEGDFGNAGYWYHKAGRLPIRKHQIDGEWDELVRANL